MHSPPTTDVLLWLLHPAPHHHPCWPRPLGLVHPGKTDVPRCIPGLWFPQWEEDLERMPSVCPPPSLSHCRLIHGHIRHIYCPNTQTFCYPVASSSASSVVTHVGSNDIKFQQSEKFKDDFQTLIGHCPGVWQTMCDFWTPPVSSVRRCEVQPDVPAGYPA